MKKAEYNMMKNIVRKCCPGCGRENTLNTKFFERDFSMSEDIVAFLRYNVYRCAGCNFVYAGDIEERTELDEYYDKMSKYESDSFHLSSALERYYKKEVEILELYFGKELSILDVGCAFGGLLNEFKKAGYNNICGIEPSKRNCDYAMANYGITVYPGLLGDGILNGKKFDAIIMNSVLEHIVDIRRCINECKNLMEEAGFLVIMVPDISMFKECTDLFQQFSVEHINYFGVDTLDCIMAKEGFVNVDYIQDSGFGAESAGNMLTIWKYVPHGDRKSIGSAAHNRWGDSYEDMKVYMSKCKIFGEAIRKKIEEYQLNDGYYIWGTGTLTAMLIQLGIIKVNLIKGVFDSNKNYHGCKAYANIIENPSTLKDKQNYPIIIASQLAFNAIKTDIKNMGLNNVIINLFDMH